MWKKVFAEHVLVPRPRLFRGLVCLFVLSAVREIGTGQGKPKHPPNG